MSKQLPVSLLMLDDEEIAYLTLKAALARSDLSDLVSIDWEPDSTKVVQRLKSNTYDVLLIDLNLGEGIDEGISLIPQLVRMAPKSAIMVLSSTSDPEAIMKSTRAGAAHYVIKGSSAHDHLFPKLRHVVSQIQGQRGMRQDYCDLVIRATGGVLIGEAPALKKVLDRLGRLSAMGSARVLIYGESGTGKEMTARAVHALSRYRKGPLVPCNSASIPRELFESELFGYKKNAFTGANADKKGLYEAANGGTLFLDEIGEMPLELQAKLLRASQENSIRPLGANTETVVDVQIVAATNRDLREEVEAKRFRADLYFRLNQIDITLPPLRDRGDDVVLLARHYIQRAGSRMVFAEDTLSLMREYRWPGNVRELETAVMRACMLLDVDVIEPDDFVGVFPEIRSTKRQEGREEERHEGREAGPRGDSKTLDQMVRNYKRNVITTTRSHFGTDEEARLSLSIERPTWFRLLRELGLPGRRDMKS